MRTALILVLLLAATTPAVRASASLRDVAPQDPPATAEKLIATIPDGIELTGPPETDPNGKRVQDVSTVVFRKDGGQVAYVGFKGARSHPVIGTTVGDSFDYLDTPIFGGEHVFFRAGNRTTPKTEKWWVYADGKKTAEEDWIGAIACNADGTELAYWVQPGAKIEQDGAYSRSSLVLVVGKRRGPKWQDAESLTAPRFSPDGTRVLTAAMKDGKWLPLIATKKGEEPRAPGHGMIAGCVWRPDGQEIAIAAVTAGDAKGNRTPPRGAPDVAMLKFAIVSGKDVFGKKYDSAGTPVFSPDGKKLAYKVLKGAKVGIAIGADDKVEPAFECVGRPVFSPDGSEIAYAANAGGTSDPQTCVTEAGDPGTEGGQWFLVRGKEKSEPFARVGDPVYSPDGKRLAHPAMIGGKWHVVCGKSKSPAFDSVGPPAFTPDGKQICFGARLGRELWWKVMAVE